LGIAFEYPQSWNLETSERVDNLIVLQSKGGLFEQGSARLELLVRPPGTPSYNLEEGLENRIETEGRIYDLEAVNIIQRPTRVESQDYQIATAIITIPTTAIPENSSRNQMGVRDSNITQQINIYAIKNGQNRYIEINIYRGTSKELNSQAEEIVNSIRFKASNR
jgi:hypothetical protein